MFKKFYNLSECELNTKKQRRSLCQNDIMTTVIKLCRGKEKQVKEKQMGSEKVKDSKILRFHNVENMKLNQKQETYLSLKKYSNNILLRFIKLIIIFVSITEKKIHIDENGVNMYYLELMFILLNIFQPQKLMRKVILTETLFLRRNDKKH